MYTMSARAAVISDVNKPLIGLWTEILERPVELSDRYEAMWNDSLSDPKAYFMAMRQEFNEARDPALLLYLLNRIVKGAVRYGRNGDFNQSADNRRLGAKPAVVRQRMMESSKVMAGTVVKSDSYEEHLVSAGPLDVVYMDPPYQGVTDVADHRYMSGLRRADYEAALREANANGVSYIVSYDVVTSDNKYGEALSPHLDLLHLHVRAGTSSQATLSGRNEQTVESLYFSPALVERLRTRGGVLI